MACYFKKSKKDITMTEEKEEDFENNNIRSFCEREILSDKIRDLCHLTRKYRGPAHSIGSINGTQDKSSIISYIFHNFSKNDWHLFF